MRIAVFGLSLTSSWGNGHATTYRSLIKGLSACGHDVTFYERDVPWYADNRDAVTFEYCRLHLYRDIDELRRQYDRAVATADAVIVGSYVPEGPRLVDWLIDLVQGRLCFYDIDTPVTLDALRDDACEYLRRDQLRLFHSYFSFAGGRALDRLADLGAERPLPLYCSVDTDVYRPPERTPAQRPRWLLGYMGTYAADRQRTVEALLLEVARRRGGDRFVVAGPGYPDAERWPDNVEWLRHVGPAEHPGFYADQAFTINATRSAMVAIGWSPSVRLFEAAACGCCIISDCWLGLDEVLEPHEELLVAETTEDVLSILGGVSDARRTAIGRAARQRVLAEHSHVRRAEYLTECLTSRVAATSELDRVAP